MPDQFLYQTKRAEFYVKEYAGGYLQLRHGPVASRKVAEEIVKARQALDKTRVFIVDYQETVVDIEPILQETVLDIAKQIGGWTDQDMIHKKKRRNPLYLHEHVVRRSLDKLAKKIRENTFALNQENPDASSET